VIKKAVMSDIDAVLNIEQASFADPWDRMSFLEALDSKDKFFFVSASEKIDGYIILEIVLDEGFITDLAVDERSRNNGIATQLVEHALDAAKSRDVVRVFLEVRSSNEEAKKLYGKFGFREIGKRKKYYSNANEDALVYVKEGWS
jgi:[ribosomal protein S18]-alanine N-acetyltransferase